jgi:hypothetical protein
MHAGTSDADDGDAAWMLQELLDCGHARGWVACMGP